jgi:hypothetical protein
MNLKDLISKISVLTSLPTGEVRQVIVSALEALREMLKEVSCVTLKLQTRHTSKTFLNTRIILI